MAEPRHGRVRGRLGLLEARIRQLPSLLGRIACLAALRNPNTGEYSHPLVKHPPQRRAAAGELLRELHERYFTSWLRRRPDEQRADLDRYFSSLPGNPRAVARTWLALETHRTLVPASATAIDRRMFCERLEGLLAVVARAGKGIDTDGLPGDSAADLLTTGEVAGWLRVAPRTVRYWAETGRLPALRVGRRWRFRLADVQRWVAEGSLDALED